MLKFGDEASRRQAPVARQLARWGWRPCANGGGWQRPMQRQCSTDSTNLKTTWTASEASEEASGMLSRAGLLMSTCGARPVAARAQAKAPRPSPNPTNHH